MFSKILIANRGEIAVRIIKTCRRMGVKTVAVYSDPDKTAPHVKLADESYRIGEALPVKSYLSIPNLCEAIQRSGAEAVHPGYGFLSEFHEFAEAVDKTGAVWIGPKPEVMNNIESKTYSRRKARESGIPTIPGSYEPLRDESEARKLLDEFHSVLIKPDRGGGGKGTRKLSSPDKAQEYLEAASRESKMYFGSGDVYAEMLLNKPRHVEVQILGDGSGNVVHLFERECSLQRRFQKVVEEAPSPSLSNDKRQQLLDYAVTMASAIGYTNAGTFEFLFEEASDSLYFLEINKRLQVEHPVTEMTTGIDLVEQQLRIASGEPLPVKHEKIASRGNAIEARIYAEDPEKLIPSPGMIRDVKLPSGENVRIDHAIEPGLQVSIYYDPLIAKLIVWGSSRRDAIDTMRKALSDFAIEGVKTSIPFHRALFSTEDFEKGSFDTTYLENHLPEIMGQAFLHHRSSEQTAELHRPGPA